MRDRGRDLSRVVEFDGGLTAGLQAHAGFSHFVEAGLGYYSGDRYGLREGGFVHINEERAEFGVPIFYLHEVRQRSIGGGMPGRATSLPLEPGYERYPLQFFSGQLTDREPFDFNVSGNLGFVGFSLTLRPAHLLDFAFGLFGADLKNNDLSRQTVSGLVGELKSSDALARRRAVDLLQQMTGKRWPEYQTSPKADVFSQNERDAIDRIQTDIEQTVLLPSAPRAQSHTSAAPAVRDASARPLEMQPLPKAASGK